MVQPPRSYVLRDSWGRPLVAPPNGGTRVPYRRTTTFVDALENTAGLTRWKLRQLATGLSHRPDLVLAIAAIDPTAEAEVQGDGKSPLDDHIEAALEPSGSAANIGTALHAYTERLDRGQKLGPVPDPYGQDLKAYEEATAGIAWVSIETFRVFDPWKVAGTADRIGWYRGRLLVADIKTGSIDFPRKISMQVAMYARSTPYDIATDTRGPAEDGLDLTHGLIIHLPAGVGRCDLHLVDLEKGWAGCELAHQVWQWRSTKGLLRPAPATTFTEDARSARDIEALRGVWRDAHAHHGLTEDFVAACGERRQELAATIREKQGV